GVALGTVAMEADDPALLICTPEAHIGLAPGAVRTTVGPPHARNHERARHQGARSALDATERFVPDHEELGTLRRRAVFPARDLDKIQVIQHPRNTERLASAIAEWARTSEVETVAGPTTGGIILAHEVARQLGARAIYAERREARSGREFRRGFTLRRGERVL